MENAKIVPLKGTIHVTVGTLLRAMLPTASLGQKILIRTVFLLDRIGKVKLW
jgi:hypothetical protein